MCSVSNRFAFLIPLLGLLIVAQSAKAQFELPPWTVGDPNTTSQHWDFLTAAGLPDVSLSNPHGSPVYAYSGFGTFLTGGGNTYNFTGPYSNHIDLPNSGLGAGYNTTFILQIEKSLNEEAPAPAEPTVDGVGATSVDVLFEGIVNGPMGPANMGVYKYTFDLTGNAASYDIDWGATIHSSMMSFRVDTQATVVPEASTFTLMGIVGIASAVLVRRRMRSRS